MTQKKETPEPIPEGKILGWSEKTASFAVAKIPVHFVLRYSEEVDGYILSTETIDGISAYGITPSEAFRMIFPDIEREDEFIMNFMHQRLK